MSDTIKSRVLPADKAGVTEAAALLRAGQPVAIPTETVYGLAANALDQEAVTRIFAAKGRPQDNPLIAHIASVEMLRELAEDIPSEAFRLAEAFWPGPLTLVLRSTGKVAKGVSAGLDTVGVRMPAHAVARAVIEEAGFPLAAPSANLSGSPSPTTAAHVLADLDGRVPLILDGGPAPVGVESTVFSLVHGPLLLRPGFVTREELEEELGMPVPLAHALHAPLAGNARPHSPGMKYRHYAPKAKITLVEADPETFAAYARERAGEGVWALSFEGEAAGGLPALTYGRADDAPSQAAALFAALRALDEKGAQTVYARAPRKDGVGLAVYNRLLRAAGFRLVRLDTDSERAT